MKADVRRSKPRSVLDRKICSDLCSLASESGWTGTSTSNTSVSSNAGSGSGRIYSIPSFY